MTENDSGALKIIEIAGWSPDGFEAAIEQAVSKASESINGITDVDVIKQSAEVRDGKVAIYHVTVKLSFVVR
jgi:flavin-binding protein dodecin